MLFLSKVWRTSDAKCRTTAIMNSPRLAHFIQKSPIERQLSETQARDILHYPLVCKTQWTRARVITFPGEFWPDKIQMIRCFDSEQSHPDAHSMSLNCKFAQDSFCSQKLRIGDFRVVFRLCFKVSPSAKPSIWKLVLFTCKFWFIHMWIKLISISKTSH